MVFLGPRGPLVLPSIGPVCPVRPVGPVRPVRPVGPVRPVCAKNLDHFYTGIYALCIIRRLV